MQRAERHKFRLVCGQWKVIASVLQSNYCHSIIHCNLIIFNKSFGFEVLTEVSTKMALQPRRQPSSLRKKCLNLLMIVPYAFDRQPAYSELNCGHLLKYQTSRFKTNLYGYVRQCYFKPNRCPILYIIQTSIWSHSNHSLQTKWQRSMTRHCLGHIWRQGSVFRGFYSPLFNLILLQDYLLS
jgi:hypothetical protein